MAKIPQDFDEETGMNVTVDLELISKLVNSIVKYKFCGNVHMRFVPLAGVRHLGRFFSAVMNLSPPNTKLEKYNTKLLAAVTEVCEAFMGHAAKAKEVALENEERSDLAAAFDGTYMNGVVPVTSVDTGKALDF
ncbi:hypothetical protein PR048_029522 [Dryococelus australis]|uniref:Uncharacterized protein n=1 Tax=Dryococelus australis TaxID=614101 RepID=A0ABQ9GDL0_9NEOP|nr:hypothetical protein PR048_029522 [Dryococelus australis]